jgi:hypothetical protein
MFTLLLIFLIGLGFFINGYRNNTWDSIQTILGAVVSGGVIVLYLILFLYLGIVYLWGKF